MKFHSIGFLFSFLGILLFLQNCQTNPSLSDDQLKEKAKQLAHKYIITDGHVDLPYRLQVKNFRLTKELIGIPISTEEGDFDYERAKEGGLDAPFMSIYIPASYQKEGGAKEFADSLINMIEGIIRAHPDKFGHGYSPAEVEANTKMGMLSLPLGMENGAPVEDDLNNLDHFHTRGIRYITLTHSKDNQICDSSYDTTATWKGLSPFGIEVVQKMNKIGIMVDISHVSDNAFYQVMKITKAPVIASHSSCRKFTPGFERNMDDNMLKELGKNGGVIQINFGSTFIDAKVRKASDDNREKLMALLDEKGLSGKDSLAKPLIEQFKKDNPTLFSDVETVVQHIDHVVQLVGIDHVGFGSDFDGVGDSLPTGIKDVSQYPNIIYLLLKKGYSEADIAKICYQNVFRVWKEVERIAKEG